MGDYMGMGLDMGKIEMDERGRVTIPSKIREKLKISAGDTLAITVKSGNSIVIRKSPTKAQIIENLVGCIKVPMEEKPTPELIKSIWKQNP